MGKDVSSFRHPERSRGIFLAGRKTVHKRKSVIPSRMKYGVYRSPHIFYLTGVQGRFLASLEMTIPGKAVLSFSALETLFPPLFHTASTLSGSLRLPPSPRGEGFVPWTAALSQMPCFHSAQTKTALRGRALQSGFWFYYSTVTDFARFLGLSTSFPLLIEV